jgi:uncharacterized membrane protein YdbT with pleckstrin-like domain
MRMRTESGEQVLFSGHPSWRSMLWLGARGLFLAVLAGVVAGIVTLIAAGHIQVGWVVAAVAVIFVIVLAVIGWRRAQITYTVTDRRLVIERGVLGRDWQETRLERVQNVAAKQSFPQRLLRVGSVHFDTAAGADYDFSFHGVSHPAELVRTVNRALNM